MSDIWLAIVSLPNEIQDIMQEYLPPKCRASLTRKGYIDSIETTNIKKDIPSARWDAYIRHVIRQDYSFIFLKLLHQNKNLWIKPIKYAYKGFLYQSYLLYIDNFAISSNSQKIRTLLLKDKNRKLAIKGHKTPRANYQRWTN